MGSKQIRADRSQKAARQKWYSLAGWIVALLAAVACAFLVFGWYPAA